MSRRKNQIYFERYEFDVNVVFILIAINVIVSRVVEFQYEGCFYISGFGNPSVAICQLTALS